MFLGISGQGGSVWDRSVGLSYVTTGWNRLSRVRRTSQKGVSRVFLAHFELDLGALARFLVVKRWQSEGQYWSHMTKKSTS